jgi:hypothetical protein
MPLAIDVRDPPSAYFVCFRRRPRSGDAHTQSCENRCDDSLCSSHSVPRTF